MIIIVIVIVIIIIAITITITIITIIIIIIIVTIILCVMQSALKQLKVRSYGLQRCGDAPNADRYAQLRCKHAVSVSMLCSTGLKQLKMRRYCML